MIRNAALLDSHEHDGAAVDVEPGIEDQRLQRIFGRAFGWRYAMNDGFEDVLNAEAAFGADEQGIIGRNREHAFDLLFDVFGLRGWQVDLVDDRENREVVARSEK